MTGTDFLLLVCICLLAYLVWRVGKIAPGGQNREEESAARPEEQVLAMLSSSMVGQRCVVELKLDAVSLLDSCQTGKAVLLDYDDEWVLLEQGSARRPLKRAIRISQIKGISVLSPASSR